MDLKKYRTKRNLTIPQLSSISGIPIRTIEDIEKRGGCNIETAKKLSEALNINLYDLVSDEMYTGKYASIEFTDILKRILPFIDNHEQMILDINTYSHGIHMKSMDKAYQIYEDLMSERIKPNTHVHWEKTEEQY